MSKVVVVGAKCVNCGAKRDICAGEVARGDQPMCDKCFSPMVPVSSKEFCSDAKGSEKNRRALICAATLLQRWFNMATVDDVELKLETENFLHYISTKQGE